MQDPHVPERSGRRRAEDTEPGGVRGPIPPGGAAARYPMRWGRRTLAGGEIGIWTLPDPDGAGMLAVPVRSVVIGTDLARAAADLVRAEADERAIERHRERFEVAERRAEELSEEEASLERWTAERYRKIRA